jgi:ClpP class serine protease
MKLLTFAEDVAASGGYMMLVAGNSSLLSRFERIFSKLA